MTIVYVLKKVNEDLKSDKYKFQYPKKGIVKSPDWNDNPECGGGLHGLLWGCGNFDIESYGNTFLVIKVNTEDGFIDLGDKVKFKKGKVILVTKNSKKAIGYIKSKAPKGLKFNYDNSSEEIVNQVNYSTANQGYYSTTNQGDYSTANQGDNSTTNQGRNSTANQGDNSTANQGYRSTANQGYRSTANQGDNSTANQGYYSTTNQGYRSTANQGDNSTANQGYRSTANQGDNSTANQGYYSTANQGRNSTANQGDNSTTTVYGNNFIYRNRGINSAVIMFYEEKMKIFQHNIDYQTNETIFIRDMNIKHKYIFTPENIKKLKKHEIFVFGSNLLGHHSAGTAKLALDKFGAKETIAEGISEQSYAFPTLNKDMQKRTDIELKESINKLIKCACDNTTQIFFLTKVGCGIAGYPEKVIKKMFDRNDIPANIIKPKGW